MVRSLVRIGELADAAQHGAHDLMLELRHRRLRPEVGAPSRKMRYSH